MLWDNNATTDTAYEVDRSSDGGNTWTTLTNTLPADTNTTAGSNGMSYADTTVVSGTAYEYRVTALEGTEPSASITTLSETASALPATYAHGDVGDAGTVGLAGSASYNATTATYTLGGAGADIWNTADGFQFAYTTMTGNGTYVAEVASMTNFASYGKAGIMMRSSARSQFGLRRRFLGPDEGCRLRRAGVLRRRGHQ